MDPTDTSSVPPAPPATATQEDKTLAMLTHLSGIILGFIVPLIIWLVNKDKADKGWLNDHAKEALNFQITLLIVYVVGIILSSQIVYVHRNFRVEHGPQRKDDFFIKRLRLGRRIAAADATVRLGKLCHVASWFHLSILRGASSNSRLLEVNQQVRRHSALLRLD